MLSTIYNLYKERLLIKPTPTVQIAKSILYLLPHSNPEITHVTPESFIEAHHVNELESTGSFDEMDRQYGR